MVLYVIGVVVIAFFEIILLNEFRHYVFQFSRLECPQEVPTLVQALENSPHVIRSLGDEFSLEVLQKLQIKQVFCIQCLFSHHCLHRQGVLSHRIAEIELVRDLLMIFSRPSLSNGTLHQTTQTRKHVDWRINVFVV